MQKTVREMSASETPSRTITWLLRLGWAVAAVGVLLWVLMKLSDASLGVDLKREVGFGTLLLMSLLSLPLGPILLLFVDRLLDLFAVRWPPENAHLTEAIYVWIVCTVAGYVQWFVLIPIGYRKLRTVIRARRTAR
jgi:hypothetical protein